MTEKEKDKAKTKQYFMNGFLRFQDKFYDKDTIYTKEVSDRVAEFQDKVDKILEEDHDDVDIEVVVKYTDGNAKDFKDNPKYKNCGSLCDIADRGIELPDDVTVFEIRFKQVVREVVNKKVRKISPRGEYLFKTQVVLTRDYDYEDFKSAKKRKYDVPDHASVYEYNLFKDICSLISFKPHNVELEM